MKRLTKIILVLILAFIMFAIGGFIYFLASFSPGTLGGFEPFKLEAKKEKVEYLMDSIFFNQIDSTYQVPKKWKHIDDWEKRGYGFLDTKILYFNTSPEEMYYVSFLGDSLKWAKDNYTEVAIRAVGTSKGWKTEQAFEKKEKNRIQLRFQNKIVEPIEEAIKN